MTADGHFSSCWMRPRLTPSAVATWARLMPLARSSRTAARVMAAYSLASSCVAMVAAVAALARSTGSAIEVLDGNAANDMESYLRLGEVLDSVRSERDVLSSLLRGMARRQVRARRECLSWLKQAIRADGESIDARDRLAAVRALTDDWQRELVRLRGVSNSPSMAVPQHLLGSHRAEVLAVLDGSTDGLSLSPNHDQTPPVSPREDETPEPPLLAAAQAYVEEPEPAYATDEEISAERLVLVNEARFVDKVRHWFDEPLNRDSARSCADVAISALHWGMRGVDQPAAGSVSTTPDPAAREAAAWALMHRWAFYADRADTMSLADACSLVDVVCAALAGTATTPQPEQTQPSHGARWGLPWGSGGHGNAAPEQGPECGHWAPNAAGEPVALPELGCIPCQAWPSRPAPGLLLGTYADPEFRAHQDHKHAVEGCGYCPSSDEEGP